LIQLYRSGNDFIGEHSDKTLDILQNTNIVNYSIGATRTMRLRQKKFNNSNDNLQEREIKKNKLKNNSIFVLGWNTNQKWLHSIKQEKSLADLGERISFTFRTIATFIDDFGNIIGQGAPKNNFNTNDELDMLQAFSKENHEIDFVVSEKELLEVKRGRSSTLEFNWFSKQFPKQTLTVINVDTFATEQINGITLEKFLLADEVA
jgi:hypothetical protein